MFKKKLASAAEIPPEIQTRKWIIGKNVDTLFRGESLLGSLFQVSLDFHFRLNQLESIVSDFATAQPGVFAVRDSLPFTDHQSLSEYFDLCDQDDLSKPEVPVDDRETSQKAVAWAELEQSLDKSSPLAARNTHFEQELKALIFQELIKQVTFEAISVLVDNPEDSSIGSQHVEKTLKKSKNPNKKQTEAAMIDNPESHMFYKIFNQI